MKKSILFCFFSCLFLSTSMGQLDCNHPDATEVLYGNNIRTFIKNGGDLFWDGTTNDNGFQVPYSDNSTPTAIFSAGLILGGLDDGENLKLSAQTYGAAGNRYDYAPGPLDPVTGKITAATCQQYNRLWSVARYELELHLIDFADNGILDNPMESLMAWPALGNPHFEDIHGFALPEGQPMAPFQDVNGDGAYDPKEGDYPLPEAVHPDVLPEQIIWGVFNDLGVADEETSAPPTKAEIQITAWAFNCADNNLLNNTIFTSHKIINRSNEALHNFHAGWFVDLSLGCFADDYVGSNPEHNSFFVYNGDMLDGGEEGFCSANFSSYTESPPVQSVTLLNREMDLLMYHANPSIGNFAPNVSDPATSLEFYNYLTGKWRDGLPLTFGGNGYMTGEPTAFAFPSNPLDDGGWSMLSEDLPFGDFRTISSVEEVTFEPGQVIKLDYAYSFHREAEGDYAANLNKMYDEVPEIQTFYDNQFQDVCLLMSVCKEECVWAGDTDANGFADHRDMLPIAVALGQEGPGRSGPYNWSPSDADNWMATLPEGVNFKHIDANGNGEVTMGDFDITVNHYRLTQPDIIIEDDYQEGPELTFSPSPSTDIDAFNQSPMPALRVRLETDEPIYGLAFTVEYDPIYFQFVTVNGLGDDWTFKQIRENEWDIAISKTDGLSAFETGNLFLLFVSIPDEFAEPLPSAQTLFRFKNIKAVKSDGTTLDIGGTDLEVTFVDVPVTTEETALEDFQIYPIPTEGVLNIQSPHHIVEQLELTDVQGKVVYRESKLNTFEKQINVSHLPKGVYFLKLFSEEKSWVKKVVVK